MKSMIRHSLLYLFAASFGLYTLKCDAPRKNPYDPANPANTISTISGYVRTESIPRQPIPGVQVTFQPLQKFAFSDQNGYFEISNVQAVDGWLIFQQQDFLSDSSFITWQKQKKISLNKFLNSKPSLDSLAMFSIVVNKYPNLQDHKLVISARITDMENDIDSVYIENSHLNIKKYLRYNADSKFYERTFLIYDFGLKSLDEIAGYIFQLVVVDKFSHKIQIGQDKLSRVIKDEVEYVSPFDYQTVSSMPTLSWKEFRPGFHFTYSIQIFTAEISPVMVFEKSALPAEQTAFTLEQPLNVGEYFWVIWCVDDFQNRSRSKPASFTVK